MSLNEQYNVITMSDVKQAVKTSTKIKWQNRWTISESGRQLYDLIPMVGNASHLDMPNPQRGRVLTEMRTGCNFSLYWSIELLRLRIGVQGLLVLGRALYF
jgi:hypothetical protein